MITKRTIEEVEAIARADDAEREAMGQHWLSEFEIQAEEARYRKQTPTQLIVMWKAGSNPEGKPLSGTEFRSLCAAWLMAFDALPPDADGSFGWLMRMANPDS